MKLSQLITAVGDENVRFQNLDECVSNYQQTRHGTKITFGTNERFGPDGTIKLGLVVWLEREQANAAIAAAKEHPCKS